MDSRHIPSRVTRTAYDMPRALLGRNLSQNEWASALAYAWPQIAEHIAEQVERAWAKSEDYGVGDALRTIRETP